MIERPVRREYTYSAALLRWNRACTRRCRALAPTHPLTEVSACGTCGESLKAFLAHLSHLQGSGDALRRRLLFLRRSLFLSLRPSLPPRPLLANVFFFSNGKMHDYITDPLNSIRLHLNVSVGSLQCPLRPHWGTPDPARSYVFTPSHPFFFFFFNARKFLLPETFPEQQRYKRMNVKLNSVIAGKKIKSNQILFESHRSSINCNPRCLTKIKSKIKIKIQIK